MNNNIVSRTSTLFRANTQQADKEFEEVSKLMTQLYPKLIFGYANLGTFYMANEKYEEADNYFQHALTIDPSDEIVLENIEKMKELQLKK